VYLLVQRLTLTLNWYVLPDLRKNPNLTPRAVAEKVQTLGIFSRDPRPEYFGQVLSAAARYAVAKRAVEMAAIGRYAEVLNGCGHEVRSCLLALSLFGFFECFNSLTVLLFL